MNESKTNSIVIYGIKNCDSVKKAKTLLENHHYEYQFIDFKKETPKDKDIKRWLKTFSPEKVINKRGSTWRALSAPQKSQADKSTDEQLALIKTNLMMIKRPIIETNTGASIGFNEAEILAIL